MTQSKEDDESDSAIMSATQMTSDCEIITSQHSTQSNNADDEMMQPSSGRPNVNAKRQRSTAPSTGYKNPYDEHAGEDSTEPRKATKAPKSAALQLEEIQETEEPCLCRPIADPWKRPEGMDEQTFERYVEEIVQTLAPVIPPNPFAVPRQACTDVEPDSDRIRDELERLLAAVGCTDVTSSCPSSSPAVRSCYCQW